MTSINRQPASAQLAGVERPTEMMTPIDGSPSKLSKNLHATPKKTGPTLHRELHDRLERVGCFRRAPWAYGIKITLLLVVGALCYLALLTGPELVLRTGLVAILAFISVQAGFIAHDAGDGGVTQNRRISLWLRHILMSFVSALSSSYFDYLHKIHHLTLSRGASEPAAVTVADNPYEIRWFKKLVSWNGIVFLVSTVCMRGVTFRLESLRYVSTNKRTTSLDRFLMALHAFVWLLVPLPLIGIADTLINYGLISLVAGPYIGTVLILNHEGMSLARSLGHLSLMERVTRSTRNLGRSRWSDFFFGGVNNHVEHHLFPQIPSMRLREARKVTSEFCRAKNVPYVETSFGRALVESAKHFRTVPRDRLVTEALS